MLCSKCSKRTSCKELCEAIEEGVLKGCNGISTYRNKEIGVSEFTYEINIVEKYLNSIKYNSFEEESDQNAQFHEEWMKIMNAIDTLLTHKQKVYIKLYLEGYTFAAISRIFNITGAAVRYAIFGHPAHGGGAVRKIQLALVVVRK